MANITHEQLIEYDARIKSYINNAINTKVVYYEQRIQELMNTVNLLQNTIVDLEDRLNGINTNTYTEPTIIDTPIIIDDNKDDTTNNDNNNTDDTPLLRSIKSSPIVRSIKPEVIDVEEDVEEDYLVYDRVIYPNPNAIKEYRNIVVTTDDRSNRIWFNMWKTFDDRELDVQDKTITIIWINADGLKGESVCGDKTIVGDRLTFSWNIPNNCTNTAGTIQFAIRIVGPNYAWHTLPTTIQCVQGLMDGNWEDIPDAQAGIDWADYIEDKWAEKLVILNKTDYDAITEKKEIVYVVKQPDTSVKMYLGETEISTSSGGSSNFDIRYDSNTYYLQKTTDGTTWTNVVEINNTGNIGNIVSLTSQQYADLPTVDPTTLYLLKD